MNAASQPGMSSLEVPARGGQLDRIRVFVSEICRSIPARPFDEDSIAVLQLGVTEAASNIVRHADAAGALRIEASWDDGALRFALVDMGRPFRPRRIALPRLDGSRAGGLGLYLIHRIMDKVVFARDEQGHNRLELVKRFPGGGVSR